MSFDVNRAAKDPAFWKSFTGKYGEKLLEEGWQGTLEADQLEVDSNWDVFDNVMNDAVHMDGKEETFAESDGGGIPGSADFASITELCGKFFVTGSYLNGGPYDTYEEAADEAGLGN